MPVLAILAIVGCKRKEATADQPPPTQANAAQVTAAYKAMTQDMTAIAFDALTGGHAGRRVVIMARTPDRVDPPPPPLGMVRRMGPTSIYSAELHEILPDGLKIRAAYPTSGNLKITEIPRADIQAIHMSK